MDKNFESELYNFLPRTIWISLLNYFCHGLRQFPLLVNLVGFVACFHDQGMPAVLPINLFQLEDRFVKHSQLAVSVGAGDVGAEVHGAYCIWRLIRKPMLKLRLLGISLWRMAENRYNWPRLQEPPRLARFNPVSGPNGSVTEPLE